jgi:hypothetical protein
MTMSPPPYVSAVDLTQTLPLGVSWTTMGKVAGTNPNEQQNAAALDQVCRLASAQTRGEAQQDLACRLITESQRGPSSWIGTLPSGQGRMLARFFPIWKVVGAAVSDAAAFPKNWTIIPPGYAYPEMTTMDGLLPSGLGGWSNAILLSPNYFGWAFGRYGMEVQVSYLHGWPHAQLTADVEAGADTIDVDVLDGYIPGARLEVMDGAAIEQVEIQSVTPATPAAYSATLTYPTGALVTLSATTYQCLIANGPGAPNGVQGPTSTSAYWTTTIEPTGPGTVTLGGTLEFDHNAGTLVTALPYSVRWATGLFAKAMALQRGLATVSLPGNAGKGVSTEEAIDSAIKEAVAALGPYRRII